MLRISSLLFTTLFCLYSFSQESTENEKYKPTFGFNFGLNYSLLYQKNPTDLSIQNAPGFRMGVHADFPIGKYLSIAPKSELSFNYGRIFQNDINYRVDPYNLDFMLHLNYRMKGYDGKVRPYCYIGPALRVPLKGDLSGNFLDTRPTLGYDFALGMNIELKHFFISPELRFTGGLMDIRNTPGGNTLRSSNVALIINFSSK
jgi:hypothetical protein